MQIQRINGQISSRNTKPQQNNKPSFGTNFLVSPEISNGFREIISALNKRYKDCRHEVINLGKKEIEGKLNLTDKIACNALIAEQIKIRKATATIREIARKILKDTSKHNKNEAGDFFKSGPVDEAKIKSIDLIGFRKAKNGGESSLIDADNIVELVKNRVNKYGIILRAESTADSPKMSTVLSILTNQRPKKHLIFRDVDLESEPRVIKGNLITYLQNTFGSAPF